jgi:uncharacterized lipoprotein
MNFRLALSGLLSAACLAGCSSPPKLTDATGEWENMGVHRSAYTAPVVQPAVVAPAQAQTYAAPVQPTPVAIRTKPAAAPERVVHVKKPLAQSSKPTVPDEAAQP